MPDYTLSFLIGTVIGLQSLVVGSDGEWASNGVQTGNPPRIWSDLPFFALRSFQVELGSGWLLERPHKS